LLLFFKKEVLALLPRWDWRLHPAGEKKGVDRHGELARRKAFFPGEKTACLLYGCDVPGPAEFNMSADCQAVVVSADERRRESWSNTERGNASWFTLFSSDMTPTHAMSAGIMEIPPNGGSLQPHRHRQAEIYFVQEGAGSLTIDGVETTIAVGTAAFIPGDAEHSVSNHSTNVLKIFYVFPTDCFADVVYRFPGSQ
jgi:mannose-6-phosphate isomerase-like protein (cupin superfamily)